MPPQKIVPKPNLEQILLSKQVLNPDAMQAIRDSFAPEPLVPPDPTEKNPPAPKSPVKNKNPFVMGSPALARTAYRVFNTFPMLSDAAKSIQEGPTPEVLYHLGGQSKLPPRLDSMLGTTVLGATTKDKRISINPEAVNDPSTLIHELGHAKGLDEVGAQVLEQLLHRAIGTTPVETGTPIWKVAPKLDINSLLKLLRIPNAN